MKISQISLLNVLYNLKIESLNTLTSCTYNRDPRVIWSMSSISIKSCLIQELVQFVSQFQYFNTFLTKLWIFPRGFICFNSKICCSFSHNTWINILVRRFKFLVNLENLLFLMSHLLTGFTIGLFHITNKFWTIC